VEATPIWPPVSASYKKIKGKWRTRVHRPKNWVYAVCGGTLMIECPALTGTMANSAAQMDRGRALAFENEIGVVLSQSVVDGQGFPRYLVFPGPCGRKKRLAGLSFNGEGSGTGWKKEMAMEKWESSKRATILLRRASKNKTNKLWA